MMNKNKLSLIILSIFVLLLIQPVFAASANFAASPSSGFAPLTVQFSDMSQGTITKWHWEFGDGAGEIRTCQSGCGSVSTSHTYTSPGTYTAKLTINDGAGVHYASISVSTPTTVPTPTPVPTTVPTTIPTTIVTTPQTIKPTTLPTEMPTEVQTTVRTTSPTITTTTATPVYTQETTLPITQLPTTVPTTIVTQSLTISPTPNPTENPTYVQTTVVTTTLETPSPVETSTVAVPTVTQTIKDTVQLSSTDGILRLTLGFPVLSVNATSADDRNVSVTTEIKDGAITFPTIYFLAGKPISIRIDLNDMVYIIRRR